MSGPFIDVVELFDGTTTRILRARDAQSGALVVLKNIRPEHHNAVEVSRLRHEYDILKLLDVPGVVQGLGLAEYDGCPALVLEDRSGRALDIVLEDAPMELSRALELAVRITTALEHVHTRRVIHKDINPNNIVVLEDEGDVELIDFELATTLPRIVETDVRPNVLEGTLAYIAPEQTGRTNRSIDNRTDLYSFGATLYRMLTGRPPFVDTDLLEIVHAHIARRPTAPTQVKATIPDMVSAIIMKLLAKMPEDRYQSAGGVRADIEECLDRLTPDGSISPFVLGTEDVSDRFRIPERLHGRETELAQLDAVFRRATVGAAEFVLIKGPAGIGKSAVIREFARSVRMLSGSYASGQFLVRDRDVPYSGIAAALSPLVQELCSATETRLATFRSQLRTALGNAAGLVTEVIPDLCLVLGETPAKPVELPADQARERAKFAFVQLFQVLARDGLAFFLDDIQWADAASLDLLAHFVSDVSGRGIVIIASERNEAQKNYRLEQFVTNLEKKGVALTTMAIGPLHVDAVRAVVSEAVDAQRGGIADVEVDRLASLVYQRTFGNPLFVATFLTTLHRDGLIDFDHAGRRWRWEFGAIEKASVPQDVAHLLSDRARKLDKNVRTTLQAAACVGPEFDTMLLCTVTDRALALVERDLGEAAQEGLIFATGNAFAFVHERVREAVLDLMDPGARNALHLRIGRELRPRAHGDKLFEVLGHINAAADLVENANERLDMARLNWEAGKAARATAAFEAAMAYFDSGLFFLPQRAFESARDLAFNLTLGAAEAAYSCNRRSRAETLYRDAEVQAKGQIEELKVASGRVRMHRVLNEYGVAKDLALAALDKYGISLPKKAGIPKVLFEFGKAERLMTSRSGNDILALPIAPSSEKNDLLAALMEDALLVVYFEDPLLHSVMTSKFIVRALSEGLSPVSPTCFAAYALLVRLIRGQAARADELCRMALQMCEKFPGLPTALVRYMYAMLILPFRHAFRQSPDALGEVYKAAKEEGNRTCMHMALGPMLGYQFHAAVPIPEFLANATARERELNELADATNNPRSHWLTQRIALFLQGKTKPGTFETDDLDDVTFIADLQRDPMKLAAPLYDFNQAWAHLMMGQNVEAKRAFERLPTEIEQPLGAVYTIGEFHWLRALVQATNMPTNSIARTRAMVAIRLDQRKLAGHAEHSAESFGHLAEFIAAESARVEGRTLAAADHYEKTVQLTRNHGFVQYEAYALERAGQYWADRNNEEVARSYLQRAYMAYQRWGATAKEAALEMAHPWLKRLHPRTATGSTTVTTRGTHSSTATGSLDARSMVVASQAVSEEIALDRLLYKLMTVAAHATGATREALVLDDPAGFVRVASFTADGGAVVLATPEPIDAIEDLPVSLLHYVLRTGKSILSEHAAVDEKLGNDRHVQTRGTKSLLVVPIVRYGVPCGMLYLENDQLVGAFDASRLALCEVLVAQMSISIDNARLYANLEKIVDERTRALEHAQGRVVALEKNATEVRMAGGFAHEMRNALTAAKMLLAAVHFERESGERRSLCLDNGEALFDMYHKLERRVDTAALDEVVPIFRQLNANEEKIHDVLGMIGASIERALSTTGMILDYAKLSTETAGESMFEFHYFIDALRTESQADFDKHGISLEVDVPAGARILGNDAHWYSILKNLVLNARDALVEVDRPEGRKIHVALEKHENGLRISVEDNAGGIDSDVTERIFEPFVSTKPNSGTGLGLGVVRKLVGLYNGTIDFESVMGRGTRFVISLPQQETAQSHK